jgi:hypothetical protein
MPRRPIRFSLASLAQAAWRPSLGFDASSQSNQRFQRPIIKEELGAVDGVSQSLKQVVSRDIANSTVLSLPLLSCSKACKESGLWIKDQLPGLGQVIANGR